MTFLLLRLPQDKGSRPMALGDEKQAPGVRRGPLGPWLPLGRVHSARPHGTQMGAVKAKGAVICADTPPRPTCSHSVSPEGPENVTAPKLF